MRILLVRHPGLNEDMSGPAGAPTDLDRATTPGEIEAVLDRVYYAEDDSRLVAARQRVAK